MSYRACLSGPKVPHTDNVCHLPLYLVEPGLIPHPSVAGPKEALGERPRRISRGVSQRAALQWFCCAEGPATSPPVTSADSHGDLGRAALPWPCLGLASGSLPWLPAPAGHGHGWNRGEQPGAQLPRGQAPASPEGGQQSEGPPQSPSHHKSRLPAATASEVTVCDTTGCICQVAIICCSITFGPHQICMLFVY